LSNVSLRGCKSSNNINLEAENSIICKKRGIIDRNHAIAKYFHIGLISNFKKGAFYETVSGCIVVSVFMRMPGVAVCRDGGAEGEPLVELRGLCIRGKDDGE
jgi:hypothetical protein